MNCERCDREMKDAGNLYDVVLNGRVHACGEICGFCTNAFMECVDDFFEHFQRADSKERDTCGS